MHFGSFFSVVHYGGQLKSGVRQLKISRRQLKSSRAGQQHYIFIFQPHFDVTQTFNKISCCIVAWPCLTFWFKLLPQTEISFEHLRLFSWKNQRFSIGYPKMFKTDSFLGNKKLSLNQNVWRSHATMQQDILFLKSGWNIKKYRPKICPMIIQTNLVLALFFRCLKWYFVTKIVLTYCEKKLF